MAKLSSAHGLTDLEIIDGPIFRTELSWLLLANFCHYNLLIIIAFDLDQWSLLNLGRRLHVNIRWIL